MKYVIEMGMLVLRRKGMRGIDLLISVIFIVLIILLLLFSNNAFITYFLTEGGDEILDTIPFSNDVA